MRAPLSWLGELCDPGWSAQELADRLALSGTDVERIDATGAEPSDLLVTGRVLEAVQHPDADRLRVCTVDTGDGDPRTIVCGAPNVAAGQNVAVALPGAELSGGVKIAKAKLRGVVSAGMICSEAELGLGGDSGGILVLGENPEPGTALGDVLPLGEAVLELDITPNRVDCLGLWGVAREVHALSGAELAAEPWAEDAPVDGEGSAEDFASVRIEVPELCPRFTARVFTDVKIGPSPAWLAARLEAAGQRPISNVVDITNYVMLLTAQPLHAFDLDKVPGGEIVVRAAREGETLVTLDGIERSLDPEMVLVCDRDRASSIAGIMGGQVSEVSEATTRVLLEVANWIGPNILRTSSRLGLRSDASARFEKQLHPELAMRAQRIASRLLVELCGAKLVPGTIDEYPGRGEPRHVGLRSSKVESLLGIPIETADQDAYLTRLGFGVAPAGEGELDVEVPPDRDADVQREADLIEEVGRIHGFDRLPATLPPGGRVGGLSREQVLRRRAEDALAGAGFAETIGWSFTDPAVAARLRLPAEDARNAPVAIHNPLSEVGSVLRTTLLGGLLGAARHNLARQAEQVRLFESGRAYLRTGTGAEEFHGRMAPPVHEPHRIAALMSGPAQPGWRGDAPPADFFAAKGALEALAASLGVEVAARPGDEPFLHPGRAAEVVVGGHGAGWIGELHPLVCREWDLDGASGFEVDLGALLAASPAGREQYEDVTSFPAVHEDIAVVVPEDLPAADVRAAIASGGGELLASAELFDVYSGDQVGEGNRSLAYRLAFRAPDRTLTDADVAAARQGIVGAIEKIGGALRA